MQLAQHKAFAQGAAAVAAKAPRASRAARCPVAVRAEKGEVSDGIWAPAASAAAGSRAFEPRWRARMWACDGRVLPWPLVQLTYASYYYYY